jgi:hypothetical protein
MKTQVIQLEPNDDVVSVRDKMSWAKTERILLVFPRRVGPLGKTLDLRLLGRHAAAVGSSLAIVARSNDLAASARDVGIPVFATSSAAQRQEWPEPDAARPGQAKVGVRRRRELRRLRPEPSPAEPAWQRRPSVRLGLFAAAVLALLALLGAFLPSAAIELTPEKRLQELTLRVSARPDLTAVTLAGEIPARLTSGFADGSQTAAVSGTMVVPDAAAAGTVRFRNLTDKAVAIVGGTAVAAQLDPATSIRFVTLLDVVLPAGVGQTVDVEVEAARPGSSGNLPANALVAIEGELGTSLSVTNPAPTSGGSDRLAPAQTADDRARLRAALLAELLRECGLALPGTLQPGDRLFPQTLALAQVVSEVYVPAENQPGEILSLTMTLQCQAEFAAGADLLALAAAALDADLPVGFAPEGEDVELVDLGGMVTDETGTTSWRLRISRQLRARLDRQPAAWLAAGRTPERAVESLARSLPLAAPPLIRLAPSWWPWLPLIPIRIGIQVGE